MSFDGYLETYSLDSDDASTDMRRTLRDEDLLAIGHETRYHKQLDGGIHASVEWNYLRKVNDES